VSQNQPMKRTYRAKRGLVSIAALTAVLASGTLAQAQTRTIVNPSFEEGPNPNTFSIHSDALHPGWISTNGEMETWVDGFLGRDAQDGDYLVELNPNTGGNQTIVYEVVSLDGNTTHQQLFSNTVTGMASQNNRNNENPWDNVTGSTVYTGPTGVQRLQFRSTNSGSTGNFLDNIQIDLVPIVDFTGTNTIDFENVSLNLPVLSVTGVVTSPLTITVGATPASTATEGLDYDFLTNTIFVPAGTYDGVSPDALYPIPLTVYEDNDHTEPDETVIIEMVSAIAANPAFNPVIANDDCTVTTPAATVTHTILNTLLIESTAENFPVINGADGGTTTSVLASDELNGAPVDPADVTLTVGASDPEITLDPATGLISVAAGTPAGTYSVEYTICEIGNPTNCSTVVEMVVVEVPEPSLTMTKVADSQGPHKAGDVITYTYTVTNDGDVNIDDVVVSDTHNGSDPAPTPGNEVLLTDAAPVGDSTDSAIDGSWDVLAPGDVVTFTGTYTVTAADVDNL